MKYDGPLWIKEEQGLQEALISGFDVSFPSLEISLDLDLDLSPEWEAEEQEENKNGRSSK